MFKEGGDGEAWAKHINTTPSKPVDGYSIQSVNRHLRATLFPSLDRLVMM